MSHVQARARPSRARPQAIHDASLGMQNTARILTHLHAAAHAPAREEFDVGSDAALGSCPVAPAAVLRGCRTEPWARCLGGHARLRVHG